MKKLIALILISTQAFAGLPPTSTKGQSDASAKVKFQFQAPHNQFTNLGGISTLIETGNGNILPDPGFEASVSGWTASGGATATANSTAKGTGAKGYDWDSNSAGQTLQSTSVTIPAGLSGKNGIAYCNIKTVSGTATHTFTVNNGTNDIVTPITIQNSTTAFLGQNEGNKINFVFPTSGTIRIKLAAVNANEPEIYTDDCSIQLANNVYDAPLVTQWTNYTPTITGAGTPTSVSFKQRRNGDTLEVKGTFVTGTVSAVLATVTLPTGLTIDTTKTTLQNISSTYGPNVGDWVGATANNLGMVTTATGTSTSLVYFSAQIGNANMGIPANGNTVWGTAQTVTFKFSVPISGWSAVSAVSADQTDYDWTSYTPTFTGFGTVTSPECQHSRVASNLMVRCKGVTGTPTAVEGRISLPNSLVSADTTKIQSIQLAGSLSRTQSEAGSYSVLIEPSVSYFTFGAQTGSTGGLNKLNASSFIGSGVTFSFTATIPIQGWSSNQRAPTIVNSVTVESPNQKRVDLIDFCYGGSATCSGNCTGGTCNISSTSNSLTSVTYNSTGNYTATFNKTYSKLFCSGSVGASGVGNATVDPSFCFNCSTRALNTVNSANAQVNTFGNIRCVGEL